MNDDQILQKGGTEEDIKDYASQNGADLTEADVATDEIFNTFIEIVDKSGDSAGKEYLKSILFREDVAKRRRLIESVERNESIYLNAYGDAISEEDYLNFEEWVESVRVEESSIEKFTRYVSAQQEKKEFTDIIKSTKGYVAKIPEIDVSLGELTDIDINFVEHEAGNIVFKHELINLINTK